MLNSLIPDFFSPAHKKHSIPDGQCIYAIGDIHGSASLLDNLLDLIRDDIAPTEALGPNVTLVFLGDYIDRGTQTPAVLDRLIGLRDEAFSSVFLKGNHEATLLQFLAEPENYISWLDWGGDETLKSYGVKGISVREPSDLAAALKNAMPKAHLAFLQSLIPHYQCGDFIFVHAGLKPGVSFTDQSERDKLWIREEFHKAPRNLRPAQTVIHGHTSARHVVDKGWRVCVDTGAVWTGALTAVVLEGNTRRFLTTEVNR